MAKPQISVIISAKNEANRFMPCLESLAKQKSKTPFEVHFVDNASTDGTYGKARKWVETNKQKNFFVWRERKPGSPSARNYGARRARGQILLFTDADCRLAPNWVQEMSKPLLESTHYPLAAVGGKTLSEFKAEKPNLWEKYLDQLFDFWENDRLNAFPAFLPWAPTCNLAVKKDIFEAIGGFDENWKSAAYDVDLCWRIILCGFTLGYAPKAQARHLRRSSLRSLLRQMENYAFYNYSLLATYEKLLNLPALTARKERMLSRGRRLFALLGDTKNLPQATFRGMDVLVGLSALKGDLEARVVGAKGNPRLNSSRQGKTPADLLHLLPRGYAHLHQEGWSYWKSPADVQPDTGDLILFRPRASERFRFNESAWRIWEVKSEGGQSEDAAEALEQDPHNKKVLYDIDQLTLDLRSRRLLP
ncbi:MAG: glycosyltransferase family 2 protein [Bacteriovoracia bacterium]